VRDYSDSAPFVKITLTDYPKRESIEANYRGCKTGELLRIHSQIFHLMMTDYTELAGGYVIRYKTKGIEAELDWRKIEIPNREEL
jgi:hypothetical protein